MQKVQCAHCGNDVWKKPSHLKRYKISFCDRKCRFDHERAKRPKVKCSACSKEIVLDGRRKRNSKTGMYFCDNKCKNPFIARYKRWSENPDQHRKRRPKVIKDADGKCQHCGYCDDERMLDVHHRNGNHKDNLWKNLICLCVWCHVGYHRGVIQLDLSV